MPGNRVAQNTLAFQGYRTTRKEAMISGHPLFVTGAQIVYNVNEAEAVCLHKHRRVCLFSHSDPPAVSANSSAKCSLIITVAVETGNRLLFAPFHHYSPLLSWNQGDIFWHQLLSYHGWNVLFPRLSNSSMNFRIKSFGLASQLCLGSRSGVLPMLEIRTCAFSFLSYRCSHLVFLRFLVKRFEIVKDDVWIGSRFLF